ncbi:MULTISPECIES: GNAT family N-acetyltransferase [Clostridium]|uniref:GNAT family N-acetyltransferase n=1 Tax=Clostridium TaxID=1485 RepID=UPI0013E9082B|nr:MULTISPECIES: GNAT family N-acetyltransferase [Clostridium]MBW9158563.1 GNAT family N-acetyltransferase [Clostridium tagluense]MBZ9635196.1 GNAT family N-acetyltransferase [Clostridium sp. FP1]WLC63702.1 GNAT family N-acetyltransferase [Clostridium tagluense]
MTNRIYFKKFLSEDDFQYFLNLVLNEKIMIMNYGRVFLLEEAKKCYKRLLEDNNKNEGFGSFKVFEMNTNVFIGSGALVINDDFTEAEVEYMILPEYWGKGYGSEIVKELLNKAEETKSIQRVTAITDPNNIGSKKILLNNDFVSCKIYEIDDGSPAEMFSKQII